MHGALLSSNGNGSGNPVWEPRTCCPRPATGSGRKPRAGPRQVGWAFCFILLFFKKFQPSREVSRTVEGTPLPFTYFTDLFRICVLAVWHTQICIFLNLLKVSCIPSLLSLNPSARISSVRAPNPGGWTALQTVLQRTVHSPIGPCPQAPQRPLYSGFFLLACFFH